MRAARCLCRTLFAANARCSRRKRPRKGRDRHRLRRDVQRFPVAFIHELKNASPLFVVLELAREFVGVDRTHDAHRSNVSIAAGRFVRLVPTKRDQPAAPLFLECARTHDDAEREHDDCHARRVSRWARGRQRASERHVYGAHSTQLTSWRFASKREASARPPRSLSCARA